MHTTQKIILTIAGIVLVFSAGYGVWEWQIDQLEQLEQSGNHDTVEQSADVESENVDVDTSNWQAYQNEEIGIKFQYPASFKINEMDSSPSENVLMNLVFKLPQDISRNCICELSIAVYDNSQNLEIAAWMAENGFITKEQYEKEKQDTGTLAGSLEQKSFAVDGNPAISYDIAAEGGGSHHTLIAWEGKIFLMSGNSESYTFNNVNKDRIMRKVYDLILANLSFDSSIEESKVDATAWQTYRNEEYGFEFRYPSSWFAKEIVNIEENNIWDNIIFGEPGSFSDGGTWSVMVCMRSNKGCTENAARTKINEVVSHREDKRFTEKQLTVNGIEAVYIMIEYAEEVDGDGYTENFIVSGLDSIVLLGNGRKSESDNFLKFVNSFRRVP